MWTKEDIRLFSISSIIIITISFLTYFTALDGFFTGVDFSAYMDGGKYEKSIDLMGLLIPGKGNTRVRPLPEISWSLEHKLWGLNHTAYHATAIMLHTINSILVLCLSFFLLRNKLVALGAGILFAIHPIHSGVVSIIQQRYDLVCALFYLSSLVSFALSIYNSRQKVFYLISLLSYLAALFSKEMALTLPLTIIFYDSFIMKRFSWRSFINRINLYTPYIAITVIYIIWRVALTGTIGGDINPVTGRSAIFDFNLLGYLSKTVYYVPAEFFIPLNRAIFSNNSVQLITMIFLSGILAVTAFSFKEIWKNIHLILFGFFWIIITLIPAYNSVGVSNMLLESRFVYLPSAGFCIALAFMFLGDKTRYIKRYLSLSIFTLFCIIYIFVTNKNNSVWISAGEINRSIPRVVNEYYKRYGADIKCFFLMPNRTGGGADLFAEELPLVLAPLFAPLGPESVVLLSEDNHGTYCAYISKDFDLRQPDRLHGLGKKVFLFRYNQDKSILEDVSLQIKSGLLKTSAYYKPDWIGDKIKAEVIKYVK